MPTTQTRKFQVAFSGTVALKGRDGKYMKVTPNNGLEFGNQVLDDTAKFLVSQPASDGKFQLQGARSSKNMLVSDPLLHHAGINNNYVTMYAVYSLRSGKETDH